MAIAIGTQVISAKHGAGVITKIITKSTGYVEVDFSGVIRKEMAFNLTDVNGQSLKSKPVKKPLTAEQRAKLDRDHARFIGQLNNAELRSNFLDSQIQSNSYNTNLIR